MSLKRLESVVALLGWVSVALTGAGCSDAGPGPDAIGGAGGTGRPVFVSTPSDDGGTASDAEGLEAGGESGGGLL